MSQTDRLRSCKAIPALRPVAIKLHVKCIKRAALNLLNAFGVPAMVAIVCAIVFGDDAPERVVKLPAAVDPAAWGGDHVHQPMPQFITGDECLFCHRTNIGTTWPRNRHFLTLRSADPKSPALIALRENPSTREFADQVQFLLGGNHQNRFLRRTPDYGRLEILSASWTPPHGGKAGRLARTDAPHWDDQTFGKSCAGCHASGVDSQTLAFSAISLDCFTCHGDVDLEHSKDGKLAILSPQRRDPPRVVVSICGQCHIRSGTSRSSGRAYPNNFVAGDNLFRDFQVDWSDKHLDRLEPIERHILENVRDVALFEKNDLDCLSCHAVHEQSTEKHQQLAERAICNNCHLPDQPKAKTRPLGGRRIRLCGY